MFLGQSFGVKRKDVMGEIVDNNLVVATTVSRISILQ